MTNITVEHRWWTTENLRSINVEFTISSGESSCKFVAHSFKGHHSLDWGRLVKAVHSKTEYCKLETLQPGGLFSITHSNNIVKFSSTNVNNSELGIEVKLSGDACLPSFEETLLLFEDGARL